MAQRRNLQGFELGGTDTRFEDWDDNDYKEGENLSTVDLTKVVRAPTAMPAGAITYVPSDGFTIQEFPLAAHDAINDALRFGQDDSISFYGNDCRINRNGTNNELRFYVNNNNNLSLFDGYFRANSTNVRGLSNNLTITVGSGGDFSTLTAAITRAREYKLRDSNARITINLLTGFVLAEQITIDSANLSYITITSADATVTVDRTAITTELLDLEGNQPFLLGQNHAILPIIGCVFDYGNNSTAFDGITCVSGSHVQFLASASDSATHVSGVRRARRGLTLIGGASAVCYVEGMTQSADGLSVGPTFENCANRAIQAQHGCRFSLPKSNFNGSGGDNAVYVIWNSFGDIRLSTATGHTGSNAAVHARDGSVLCAREVDVSDGAARGFHALHASILDARSGVADDCGTYGVLASACSKVDFTEGSATGCQYGIHASECSEVHAASATLTGNTSYGVYALSGSTINAITANISGSGVGAYASEGSIINVGGANCSGCTAEAVYAHRSSTINCRSANLQTAGTYGALSYEGSTINAQSCNASSAGTHGFAVIRGSIINAGSCTGTLSVTANAITAAGIIFQ